MKTTTKPQKAVYNYVPAVRWETRTDPVTGITRTSAKSSGSATSHPPSQKKRRLNNRRMGARRSRLPWRSR